jgi:hypothetical protein
MTLSIAFYQSVLVQKETGLNTQVQCALPSQVSQYSQLAGYSPGPGGGFFNLPQLTSYLSKANGDRQIFKDEYILDSSYGENRRIRIRIH